MTWYDDLMKDAEECRQKARGAKTPNVAKRWFEAAESAARAAQACYPQVIQQIPPMTPTSPQYPSAWIKDPQCQYCHKPLSQCQGHSICQTSSTSD